MAAGGLIAPTPRDSMAAIVSTVAPMMKAAGYRKRRHTFNRACGDDGFTQVLTFQMGAFDPPGTVEIPGLRPNLYGRFTVNLGVFVPALTRSGLGPRPWYSEYHCQLRARIGQLLPEHSDVWWRLDHSDAEADVLEAVREYALPWLSRLTSYRDVIDIWQTEGQAAVGLPYPAAPMDLADILMWVGRREEARDLLLEYTSREHVGGHLEVLRKYLLERDFGDIAGRLNV